MEPSRATPEGTPAASQRMQTSQQSQSPRSSTRSGSVKPSTPTVTNEKEALRELTKEAKEIGVPCQYLQEMKEIFKIFDADGSGAIDPKEIREQMIALGFQVDNTTIYQLISDLDSDGSQKIEFGEFLGVLKDQLKIHEANFHTRQNIKETFDFLDDLDPKNRDGKIDVSNLRRLATVLADEIPERELEVMVRCADKDGKGYVSPEDFYELLVGCASKMELQEEELQRSLLVESPDEPLPEPASPSPSSQRSSEKGRLKQSRRSYGSSKTRDRIDSVQMTEMEAGNLNQARRKSRGDRSASAAATSHQSSRATSPQEKLPRKDAGLGTFRVDRSGSVVKYNSAPNASSTALASDDTSNSEVGGQLARNSSLSVPQQVVRKPSKQKPDRRPPGARKNLSLVPEDADDTPPG